MKNLLAIALMAILVSCGARQKNVDNADPMAYANTITASDLKDHLFTFASDEFQGRETGEPGQKNGCRIFEKGISEP